MRATLIIPLIVICLCSCVSKKTFEQQVAATDSANRTAKDLSAKNADLQDAITKLKTELEQRTAESEHCSNDLNAANADLERYGSQQQRLENAIGDARQEAIRSSDTCQQQITHLKAQIASLNKQAESERISCQARLANMKNTCDQLTGVLEAAQTEATTRADNLEQNLEKCKALRSELEQQGADCRQQLADVDAAREDLKGQLADLQAQFAVLEKEHQAAEAAMAKRRTALEEMATRLRQGLQAQVDRGDLGVQSDNGKITVSIGDKALFAGQDTDLKPAGEALLGRVGSLLQGARELEVDIEAHGGRVPVSDELKQGAPSQWQLATDRAVQVMYALRLQSKMSKARLAIVDAGPAPVLPKAASETGRDGEGHIDLVLRPERAPSPPLSATPSP